MFLYQQNNFSLTKEIENGFVIINQDKGTLVTLNEVSFFLWNKLKKPQTANDLVKLLLDSYKVDRQTASKDVKKFLKTSLKSSIIKKLQ